HSGGHRGKRPHAVRYGRGRRSSQARRGDHWNQLHSRFGTFARGGHRHHAAGGPGSSGRFDADEVRHCAETGTEHAEYRSVHPVGLRLREPDGQRAAEEYEAGGPGAAHRVGGGGSAGGTRGGTAHGSRQQRADGDRDGQSRNLARRSGAATGAGRRPGHARPAPLKKTHMDKFVITGGNALKGEIPTSGSKNSALPALAAALLTEEPVILHRIPRVRDIRTMQRLLVDIGSQVDVEDETVRLHTPKIVCPEAPYELVKTMRASSLVLGPLVARSGRARVSLPGGCAIGARPINLHIFGLERLGARIHQSHGYIEAQAPEGLRGAVVHFDRITVTGTEDLLMAAVLAKGETVLRNAAREPEVTDLADLLTKMGAKIEGAGTSTIRIQGVERLGGAEHTIIPDRIEAGTFLIAGAITGGDLKVAGCNPEHVGALVSRMQQAGVDVTQPDATTLHVRGNSTLRS